MTPLYEHEHPKVQFDRFIFALAEKLEFEIKSAGSITLKREDVNRGIEPDNCYYIKPNQQSEVDKNSIWKPIRRLT